jgi:hypothetical protein
LDEFKSQATVCRRRRLRAASIATVPVEVSRLLNLLGLDRGRFRFPGRYAVVVAVVRTSFQRIELRSTELRIVLVQKPLVQLLQTYIIRQPTFF